MTAHWPIDVLSPENYDWQLLGGIQTGGQTLAGDSQTGIFGGGGRWVLEFTRVLINTADQHLSLRALQVQMNNGANPVIVSMPDYAVMYELQGDPNYVTFSDGASFDDATLFEGGNVEIISVGVTARRATAMRVHVVSGPPVVAGFIFSVLDSQGYPRRHQIGTAEPVVGQTDQYDITYQPPLRSAVGDATDLNFTNPGCVMKVSDPRSVFGAMLVGRFGEVSPIFVEYPGDLTAV